jgi:ubiquinone/menaquinone biosynthesis C-methylase UbiE
MPDELENFQTSGQSWQERAEQCEGVDAVYSPNHKERSQWLSLISSGCLQRALRRVKKSDTVVDFGCGIGHHTHAIYLRAGKTMGVDVTQGMIQRARASFGHLPILFEQIDGIHLPVESNSVALIWISGVLRYSLLVPNPKHREIVNEFFRVLKPGGWVYNFEMYVDQPSAAFSKDFLEGGFSLLSAPVVHLQRSKFDQIATGKYRRLFLRKWWADFSIWWTKSTVKEPRLDVNILRDYFFEYRKPIN